MDTTEKPGGVDLAELNTHHEVLTTRAQAIRKQLDRGVPQLEFKKLYMLFSAMERAAGVLGEIRAAPCS